jgi:hypothetical protein
MPKHSLQPDLDCRPAALRVDGGRTAPHQQCIAARSTSGAQRLFSTTNTEQNLTHHVRELEAELRSFAESPLRRAAGVV